MRTRTLVLALAVAALVPTSAFAQQGGQGGMGRGMGGQGMGGLMAARNLVEQGNVAFLAGRSELQLTAEQTAALRVIAERWDAETKEAREQVRPLMPAPGQAGAGMGGMGGGDRQAMMQRFQELAPVIQKLVEDDRKALDEAMKHLSEAQQATARRLVEERNQPRRPGS